VDFKGAIFDLDGTLLDSMGIWADIDKRFLAKRGIALPDDYVEKVTPLNYQDASKYTIERFQLAEKQEDIIREWVQMSVDAYRFEIKLKPFVKEYLTSLKHQGIELAVATAQTPELYEPTLKNNGIFELFDVFTNLSEVNCGKGFPDIYILSAQRLKLAPQDCIVFEDIYAGICGAKAGNFRTCGVHDSYSAYEKDKIENTAEIYINSFRELLQ